MVEACHLQIQCANFDMMKGMLLKYELHLEQFTEPYVIHIPNFNHSNGRPVGMNWGIFGVLSMFWDTKTANASHHDPLPCAVGALATMLHFTFDQGGLWARPRLGLGQCVIMVGGNWPVQMYKVFLDATSVSSSKKAHLARVSENHIDAVGHWVGNVVTALAGFYVGETYRVPRTEVPVPGTLTKRVFPFVEETLAALGAEGC
ncbi:hypothetical protein EI94DRAFT_1705986 [Lactarius quietus]|nr:hypothetical protein EI94DRAFT_1705986 [Lactarius quietus]